MNAALGGEQAVGVLTPGDEGRRLEAGLVAGGGLLHLDLEAAPLGPAQVHAQEHLGPVLRVGAAGPGADSDHGVACVVAAVEQARLLERPQPLLQRAKLGVELAGELGVVGRQLGELLEVRQVRLEGAKRLQPALGCGVRRGRAGGLLGVVPEAGPLHLRLELLYLGRELGGVKGSPRAASGPRGPPRAARTRSLVRRPRP